MSERFIVAERYADNGALSHTVIVDTTTGREIEFETSAHELNDLDEDNERLMKDLVQYKKLWALRGEALKRPCLSCGYVQKQIVPMEGSGNE